MDGHLSENDISHVVDADRAHVWHHLTQHKPFETGEPRVIIEGKGMRVWDQHGKEFLDAVSGGVWTVNVGYGRESIANAVRDQLIKLNYFAGSAGSVPGALFAEKSDLENARADPCLSHQFRARKPTEKAFKMVRQIAHKRYGGKKSQDPLSRPRLSRLHHRRDVGCGGQDERNVQYGPFAPDFVRVPHCMEYREHAGLGSAASEELWRMGGQSDRRGHPARRPRHRWRALPGTRDRRRRRHHPRRRATGPEGAGDLPQIRHPAAYRRSGLRRRPHRHRMVRLSALRDRARFRDHGQGRGLGLCRHCLSVSRPNGRFRHVQG